MLKYTKYILGTTFVCLSTLTVVYALPKESRQSSAGVVHRLNEKKIKSDQKSEVLLAQAQIKDYTDVVAKKPELTVLDWTLDLFRNNNSNLIFLRNSLMSSISILDINQIRQMTESVLANVSKSEITLKPTTMLAKIDSKTPINKASESFALIPVSYATYAQSEQQQQINYNINYIDIRTKVTYLKSYLETLEMIKKTRQPITDARINELARTQLQNNIEELADYRTLVKAFNETIYPKNISNNLTAYEKKYAEFASDQIEQAGQIKELETSVTQAINQKSDIWTNKIAQQVKDELKRQAVPALW
jgi:hypothetical protein